MQYDDRVNAALTAMRPRIAQYRFAVSGTLERTNSLQLAEAGPVSQGATLGQFASGRIDLEKFAKISAGAAPIDVVGYAVLDRAIETLKSLLDAGDSLFVVSVPPGTSSAAAIKAQLAKIGSAFGAADLVDLVRRRAYDPIVHGLPSYEHPFDKWTAGERRIAPPLFVRINGSDLDPAELSQFLDGSIQLILFVDGQAAPAPLARLISPGVFVAQADDVAVLEKVAQSDTPAVVALMSGREARFIHEPRGGSSMFQRVRVIHVPDAPVRKALGSRSAWQMREDVALLKSYVELPAASTRGAAAIDPTERLTAWLLEQSSLASAS